MKGLYLATIYHKRFFPRVNEFTYSGHYIKFSLKQMKSLKSKFFGVNSFNLFSFYEKDHGYRNGSDLNIWVRETLNQAGIKSFDGEVILQTFPRVLGYVFNPVSFWYCYQNDFLVAIICEVNNTFGESHSYVVKKEEGQLPKEFHVSPFYDRLGVYQFDFKRKDSVTINYYFDQKLQLCTGIKGQELELSDFNLLKLFLRFPFFTIWVVVLIHYQALKLYLKKITFYPKPQKINKEVTYE